MLKRSGANNKASRKKSAGDPSGLSPTFSSSKAMNRSIASNSDAVSTLSSLSSPSRRKLKFKPTIQIREYKDDKDETEKARMFYTDEEYERIEASNTEVVELIGKNSPKKSKKKPIKLSHIEKTLGDTGRGLEKMSPEEWDRMQDRREAAQEAVFREQARQQRQRGKVYDPHAISKAYERVTVSCKDEASDNARVDERFVSRQYGPLEPSGIKLSVSKVENVSADTSTSVSTRSSNITSRSSLKKRHPSKPAPRRKQEQQNRRKPDPI